MVITITSAIILAGGKSLRLGREKALERINGQILIERVINRVSSITAEVVIVTGEEKLNYIKTRKNNIQIVSDIFPGKAALGAIYTGLIHISGNIGIVVACDMPFLNTDLLTYLVIKSTGYDAVIPKINHFIEPLHGIYAKTCIDTMKNLLDNNNLSVASLFKIVKTKFVHEEEINRIDPEHLSFFNINTEKDLLEANRIAAAIDI